MYSDIETKLGMGQWVLKLEQFWPKCQNYHRLGAKRWPMVHGEFDDGCWWLLWRFFCRSHFMTGLSWTQVLQSRATGEVAPEMAATCYSFERREVPTWKNAGPNVPWQGSSWKVIMVRNGKMFGTSWSAWGHHHPKPSWEHPGCTKVGSLAHRHYHDLSSIFTLKILAWSLWSLSLTIINHCNHHHSGLINSNSWVRL